MTGEQFFDAFGEIYGAYILAAGDVIYGGRGARVKLRKAVRTALIAAAIAGLLTLTAYAAGWLGISARMIKDPGAPVGGGAETTEAEAVLDTLRPVHHRDYISLGGVSGTAEYRAAAEWLAFRGRYADEKTAQQLARGETYYDWRDLERGFAPDARTRGICRLYQVWDAPMWEKLQEIAAKYGLALHTTRTAITGAGNQPREFGCYEDGSFVVSIERAQYMYTLYLERTGYLPCDDMAADGEAEYEEWEYAAACGRRVSIAVRDVTTARAWPQYDVLIFAEGDGALVTVKTSYGHSSDDKNADVSLFAEELADSIDFAAVEAAGTAADAVSVLMRGD